MSYFNSLKAEIKCEMCGQNERIPTAFFCSVAIRLCLNSHRFKQYIRCG